MRSNPLHAPLFQVYVETAMGDVMPVGPKASEAFVAKFAIEINKQITLGKEKVWTAAHIMPAESTR